MGFIPKYIMNLTYCLLNIKYIQNSKPKSLLEIDANEINQPIVSLGPN